MIRKIKYHTCISTIRGTKCKMSQILITGSQGSPPVPNDNGLLVMDLIQDFRKYMGLDGHKLDVTRTMNIIESIKNPEFPEGSMYYNTQYKCMLTFVGLRWRKVV